jgi:hypothetical protein
VWASQKLRTPWGAKQASRAPTCGREDRLLGCEQLRAQCGWGAEGEQPVVQAVACDLVAVCEDLAEQRWVVVRVSAEDEEGRAMAALGEQATDVPREAGVGAIVEAQLRNCRRAATRRFRKS